MWGFYILNLKGGLGMHLYKVSTEACGGHRVHWCDAFAAACSCWDVMECGHTKRNMYNYEDETNQWPGQASV